MRDPKKIAPVPAASSTVAITGNSAPNTPRPDAQEARALLETPTATGVFKKTKFWHAAKKRLAGRDYAPCIFDMMPPSQVMAPGESRHDTLKAWVASAGGLISNLPTDDPDPTTGEPAPLATASHLYGLFLPVADGFEADDGGVPGGAAEARDWSGELWRITEWTWAHEQTRIAQEAQVKQVRQEKAAEEEDAMIRGVREWFPELPADPADACDWVRPRMILYSPRGYHHLLTRSGYYDRQPIPRDALAAQIETLGLQDIIPLESVNQKTLAMRPANYNEITKGRMTVIHRIVSKPQLTRGGYLENPGDKNPTLVLSAYERNPNLVPEFNEHVDTWMFKLAQENFATYERLNYHTAFQLHFGFPNCGLGMFGSPSAGKQMYARGVAETLRIPALASARDLVDNFNAQLLKTPFLVVDEAFPTIKGFHRPVDAIRHYTSGDGLHLNRKFYDVQEINNPVRFIFTANNHSHMLTMVQGQDLNQSDSEALNLRIWYLDIGGQDGGRCPAAEWLAAQGGYEFTKGWVEGPGGQPSNYTVAKHFLWLYQEYCIRRGFGDGPKKWDISPGVSGSREGRLLMEGDLGAIAQDMRTQGGHTPLVLECIVGLLNRQGLKLDTNCTPVSGVKVIEPNTAVGGLAPGLYVTAGAIVNYYRGSDLRSSKQDLTPRIVKSALLGVEGLICGGAAGYGVRVRRPGDHDDRRYSSVDVKILLDECVKYGWTCRRLEDLAMKMGILQAAAVPVVTPTVTPTQGVSA